MSSSRPAPPRLRPSTLAPLVRGSLGFLTLALAFALSSPGVRIARADDAPAAVSIDPVLANATASAAAPAPLVSDKPGPSCSNPGPGSMLNDAMLQYQTERLLRQMVQQAAEAAPASPDPQGEQGIVLNGRGYNYPSGSTR
jgi:hypothetical protein